MPLFPVCLPQDCILSNPVYHTEDIHNVVERISEFLIHFFFFGGGDNIHVEVYTNLCTV